MSTPGQDPGIPALSIASLQTSNATIPSAQTPAAANAMKLNQTPDFIRKLLLIVEDSGNQNWIKWSQGNDSIIIVNPQLFAANVLPLHFKHNKFASFVRQLNKHNFHRVKLPSDNPYGESACEYKHYYFKKNRSDLMEKISRQISTTRPSFSSKDGLTIESAEESSSKRAFTEPPVANSTNSIDSGNISALEQGQRRSFYQIKDLERRMDFVERELGSCRYIVESQSRLIKRLLVSLPKDSRNTEGNVLGAVDNQNWHEPSFDPYPYHPSNYRQNYQNSSTAPKAIDSTSPSVNSGGSQNNNGSANGRSNPSTNSNGSRNRSDGDGNRNGDRRSDSNGNGYNSNSSGNPTLIGSHPALIGSTSTPYVNGQHPFNNQLDGPWGTSFEMTANRPDCLAALNVLILLSQQPEQRFISDLLIELQCLSHKFAFDISHVIHCLEERKDFHVLILDRIYESASLLGRLKQLNPSLLIIFISDDPIPLVNDINIRVVLRPPTVESLQTAFQDAIQFGPFPIN